MQEQENNTGSKISIVLTAIPIIGFLMGGFCYIIGGMSSGMNGLGPSLIGLTILGWSLVIAPIPGVIGFIYSLIAYYKYKETKWIYTAFKMSALLLVIYLVVLFVVF